MNREKLFIDDIISKHHIEKELLLNLTGIKTVFDGGAGYGRFSVLLAKQGLKVTHFDISLPMTVDKGLNALKDYKPDMEAVNNFYRTGLMEKYEDTIMKFTNGETPWPVSYAFLPDEIKEIMENKGLRNIKYAGPGALSRSIPGEVLINIMKDEKLKEKFLEFCYEYDSQKWVAGMGKDNILINAEI